MTKSNETNKPAATLRDGGIKATIWQNEGRNGPFFSVKFVRTYVDDQGQYHDTDTFKGVEALRIGRLAARAYDAIVELRAQEAA